MSMTGEPTPAPRYVYKVLSDISQGVPIPVPSDWEFRPEQQDLEDGFIHLARAGQVLRVLERGRYVAGTGAGVGARAQGTVMLVKIDYARMKAWKIVKWERGREGVAAAAGGEGGGREKNEDDDDDGMAYYPHLYGQLTGQFAQYVRLVQKSSGNNSWEAAVRALEASGWLVE